MQNPNATSRRDDVSVLLWELQHPSSTDQIMDAKWKLRVETFSLMLERSQMGLPKLRVPNVRGKRKWLEIIDRLTLLVFCLLTPEEISALDLYSLVPSFANLLYEPFSGKGHEGRYMRVDFKNDEIMDVLKRWKEYLSFEAGIAKYKLNSPDGVAAMAREVIYGERTAGIRNFIRIYIAEQRILKHKGKQITATAISKSIRGLWMEMGQDPQHIGGFIKAAQAQARAYLIKYGINTRDQKKRSKIRARASKLKAH